MRNLSLVLVWLGVLVLTLAGVLLYLAGGLYLGITLVLVAVTGAAGLIALHLSRA